jgi:translation initiation factor 2 alpha subunit (eIF-2alpha)
MQEALQVVITPSPLPKAGEIIISSVSSDMGEGGYTHLDLFFDCSALVAHLQFSLL